MKKLSKVEIALRDFKRSEEDLYESYPRAFKAKPGICVGVGWHGILHEVGEKAEKIISKLLSENPLANTPYIYDIKQKYGVLVISFTDVSDLCAEEIFSLEEEAEQKSASCCEMCSNFATQSKSGWIITLCEKHMKSSKD